MSESKLSEQDEEAFAMQRITDTLVAAGYFRARLAGLSAFDKVVGGMCWAMTASGIPVEMDVEFKENPSLGEKITVSENIVRALRRMKCPVLIKPHQIQGVELSCQPLFPVVQWLVKAVYDHRLTTGNLTRKYSAFRFTVDFPATLTSQPTDMSFNTPRKRAFSKSKDARYDSDSAFVDATLLEYGHKFRVASLAAAVSADADATAQSAQSKPSKSKSSKKTGKLDASKFGSVMSHLSGDPSESSAAAPTAAESAELEAERLAAMAKSMDAASEQSEMTGSKLVDLIDSSAVAAAEESSEEGDDGDGSLELLKNNRELAFKKKMDRIQTKIDKLEAEKEKIAEEYSSEVGKLEELESELSGLNEKRDAIAAKISELNVEEAKAEHRDLVTQLKQLVLENESLKKQRVSFEEQCREQGSKMEERMRILQEKLESGDSDEAMRIRKIEEYYEKQMKKRGELGKILAQKNQELSRLSRELEKRPSRAELLQYEKRFVELYAETNVKLKETKKLYELYNSLGDVHSTMENEVSLATRIRDEFPTRIATVADCSQFVSSLKKIVCNLDTLLSGAQDKLSAAERDKSKAADTYSKLLSIQRKYYVKVKEFQDICQVNEEISRRLELTESKLAQL